MLYPRDEAGQRRTLTLNLADHALNTDSDHVLVSRAFLAELLDLPDRASFSAELRQRHLAAFFTTRILHYIISLKRYYPEHASVLRSVEVLEHYGRKNPGEVPASPAWIKKQWTHFKPVAHLWCASMVVKTEAPDFQFFGIREGPLLKFLAIAEWFRFQGEAIKARAQTEPALDPATNWTPPPDIKLPVVDIDPGAPSEEMLEVLRRYRAPKKI